MRFTPSNERFLGVVKDVFGKKWIVSERRMTLLGWDVQIGKRDYVYRGAKAVILTKKLAAYLKANIRICDIQNDLPISRSTLKHLRKKLHIKWSAEVWWKSHKKELNELSLEKFSAKYGVSSAAASHWRDAFRQNISVAEQVRRARGREPGRGKKWWKEREKDLMKLSLNEFSKKHKVSVGIACDHRQAVRLGVTFSALRRMKRKGKCAS
jgi:hypothetical protein